MLTFVAFRTGTEESAIGDWLADILMHSYAESLESKGGHADIVFNCGGSSDVRSLSFGRRD